MAKHQFEVDSNETVEDIAVSFALCASAVMHDRFPNDDKQWAEAMTEVVRVINEHVRQAQEISEG